MKHSERVRWFERAYERIREELVPEAPPGAAVTISVLSRKKSGQNLLVGETHHDCYQGASSDFGGEILIALHPMLGDDLVLMMTALVCEMIHAALEPAEKNKKEFQKMAAKVGLEKPWAASVPSHELENKLRGLSLEITEELGYAPEGVYVAPPKPAVVRKAGGSKRVRCKCTTPRILSMTEKQVEKGPIMCGLCKEKFQVIEDTTSVLDSGSITNHDVSPLPL